MSINNILEVIQDVLQDCNSASSSVSFEETDRITFQLESCNHYLAAYISDLLLRSEPISHDHCSMLRQLHQCINDLQDIWRIKLARIEGRSLAISIPSEGKPCKLVNTELVSLFPESVLLIQ